MEAKSALYDHEKKIRVLGKSVGIGGQDLPAEVLAAEIQGLLEGEDK